MSTATPAAKPPIEASRRLQPLWVLYGLLGLALLTYFAALVLRPEARESLLLNGWGSAAFEIVVSVLALVRGATERMR